MPPALAALGDTGRAYYKLLAAGSRSIHRETLRLTLLAWTKQGSPKRGFTLTAQAIVDAETAVAQAIEAL